DFLIWKRRRHAEQSNHWDAVVVFGLPDGGRHSRFLGLARHLGADLAIRTGKIGAIFPLQRVSSDRNSVWVRGQTPVGRASSSFSRSDEIERPTDDVRSVLCLHHDSGFPEPGSVAVIHLQLYPVAVLDARVFQLLGPQGAESVGLLGRSRR